MNGWVGRAAAAVAVLPLLAGCVSTPFGGGADADAPGRIPRDCEADTESDKRDMRGSWITTVRNIDWPSEPGLSAQEQQQELRDQLDSLRDLGFNAAFFHVRPTADAVYESDKEPWARYLTGKQGGDPGYDPLAFAVEEAHKRGLELHAWFNPYRVGLKDPDLENLVDEHPAKQNPGWLIEYGDEGYLDPGNPEVQGWVGDVILDVVERYDIDGVHFDDFFYPYPDGDEEFDDDASWKEYGEGFDDRSAWRRSNVNTLIADVHARIGKTKPWVRFGISPFGIWRNDGSDASGSATKGLQSYDDQYADTRSWIQEGIVDYVLPQLYWERGFENADYEELVRWWSEEVSGSEVDLYIGQAAYRVGDDGWTDADSLSRQLDFNKEHPEVSGNVYFSQKDLTGRAGEAVDRLVEDHYRSAALPPRATGSEDVPDPVPRLDAEHTGDSVQLEWDAVENARFYAVYRVPGEDAELCDLADATHLLDVIGPGGDGSVRFTDTSPTEEPAEYFVTALDDHRSEGAPSPPAPVDHG
ncbi:glycoside hydrolase family 10 protein [Allosalinactinospora lopnorensis]|uniref:glycoside hydrolase family 10 protein n=1 Tax=Allosalinactinospora lopnorensis TaxID=1352348 RepID=UPI000623EFDB|nr:family 10 glycosylhydrolase [Allosalinactinospora lopnorensis]